MKLQRIKGEGIVELFLQRKEWHNFDCKRAVIKPSKLLETVVAFANADGGRIVLGLEDPAKAEGKKRLLGIDGDRENVAECLKQIDKDIDPSLPAHSIYELEIENVDGQKDALLVISIAKSNEVHSMRNGDTFLRKGDQTVKIGAAEIIRLKYEKGTFKYEDEPSGIRDLSLVDETLLARFKKGVGGKEGNDWAFLRDNGLALRRQAGYELTKGGALLFCKNPTVSLKTKCGIKISHYYGTAPNYSGEPNFVRRPFSIEGPLLTQIEKVIEYFRDIVRSSPPKLRGAAFRSSLLIPEWAFQEAITNAVIHRNYAIPNDIQIRFFDDRIEVESPGTFPGNITVNNIRTERYSRNPVILRTLNRFQGSPNLDVGEGVDRMFQVMRENNLYEPRYAPPTLRPHTVLLGLLNILRVEEWDTVSAYLDRNFIIANEQARHITGIQDTLKMSRLLKSWVEKGLLEKVQESSKRHVFYRKPGIEIPDDPDISFSGGGENEN